MGRKNLLADLADDELTAVNSETPASLPTTGIASPQTLGARGVVGAMSRSLERLTSEVEAARSAETRLTSGSAVVDLEPELVEGSFVTDRMADSSDPSHVALIESIRAHGQQVPILVRPHPEQPGRYQAAYGHRRLRAAAELGCPVRAVVKQLGDDELVVAQGQENSARKDLSYIERAIFAATLENKRFARSTIMAALSVDKTELSRLLSISRSIPRDLIQAIGPAGAGRRRWLDIAERLKGIGSKEGLSRLLQDATFRNATPNERIVRVLNALSLPKPTVARENVLDRENGRQIVQVKHSGRRLALVVEDSIEPDFATYIVDQLPKLYRNFQKNRQAE